MWSGTESTPPVAYTAEEALAMDRWLESERGFTVPALMERAGAGLAEAVEELTRAGDLDRWVWLVGPGHNGGDAEVARELLGPARAGAVCRPLEGDALPALTERTLVVDGLFGVGLVRPLAGHVLATVEALRASPATVLAVDVPSGLCATTGRVLRGDDGRGAAVVADRTLTFVGPKAGFFLEEGPAHVGLWRAVEIGFPAAEAAAWVTARRAGAPRA